MIYDTADRAIKAINRYNLRLFSRMKMARWDRLNVIGQIRDLYRDVSAFAKAQFIQVARDAYWRALMECDIGREEARRRAREEIDEIWIEFLLINPNELTLYIFDDEVDRKRERLVEAVAVAENKAEQIDKALKLLTRQLAQYVDIMVSAARFQAFEDAGVDEVVWVTQRDERVCKDCGPLDGQVFQIDEAPNCPLHYQCRCHLEVI